MALKQTCRTNYQVGIWKELVLPILIGWHIVNGRLEPLWVERSIDPPYIEEFLQPVAKKKMKKVTKRMKKVTKKKKKVTKKMKKVTKKMKNVTKKMKK